MRAWKAGLLVVATILGATGGARAGGLERLGTAGAQELRIPVGAASIALGGSAVAMSNGLANLYFNPAALAATDQSEAIVSYSTYLADSKVNYGAVSTGLGTAGNIALSLKVLSVGDIVVTTEDAPEGTGEILNPSFTVLGLSYARRMTDRVLIGMTGSYVQERIADAQATGLAVDLGVQYDTGWRGVRFGFAMKNVGPAMRFDGPDFERRTALPGDSPTGTSHVVHLEATEFEIPSYLQLGIAYDVGAPDRNMATLFATFQGNNFSNDEYRLGGEYHLSEWLALRAGVTGQTPLQAEVRQPDYLYSYTYGAGLRFRMGSQPVHFDWAGTNTGQYFDDNQQFSLRMEF
jgi:hypothetical protein